MDSLSRRDFARYASAGFMSAALPAALVAQTPSPATAAPSDKARPPGLSADLVKEFVIAGHSNLPKVQSMLQAEPGLLNAAWDWGKGDFEMAIGGAGHMGRADIAEYLLSQGSRMDIFVAAMLGKLDVVRATLTAYPELKDSRGPHGISLIRHAEAGKERATEVLAFLKEVGAK
jgi:hypothetical protein